jgi:hypothetical protein
MNLVNPFILLFVVQAIASTFEDYKDVKVLIKYVVSEAHRIHNEKFNVFSIHAVGKFQHSNA